MVTADGLVLPTFESTANVRRVVLTTREPVVAICPFDGNTDEYEVRLVYGHCDNRRVAHKFIEAGGYAEYLASLADARLTCEELAYEVARTVRRALPGVWIKVRVRQLSGEDVEIVATARP